MHNNYFFLYHAGTLSKSKGLILRVAAVMHVAFHLESPHEIPKEISQKALEAAQDFVDMCCQHAAFMALNIYRRLVLVWFTRSVQLRELHWLVPCT